MLQLVEISMKESFTIILSMDKELNIYRMVIYIKDSMQMENQRVKENIGGIQEAIIMEPL